jgi:hypothetical protein
MKTYGEVEVQLHALTLALDGNGNIAGTHWTEGWAGPRPGLDAVAQRQKSLPCRELNAGRPACSLVTNTDGTIPYPQHSRNNTKNLLCFMQQQYTLIINLRVYSPSEHQTVETQENVSFKEHVRITN